MSAITFDCTTTTEEIKARLDIVDIIGEYVKLTRRGRDWWGLCPLHDEKTPSFSVSPGKQIFHCFGCNQGGDIFAFIMKYHNTDFKAARDLLAARAGISTGMDRETCGTSGGPRKRDGKGHGPEVRAGCKCRNRTANKY